MRHYMELTDSTFIEAFPKAEESENIKSDATEQKTLDQRRLTLFLQNAHRLIGESDRIMADSRMFLAPVPIRNGLAYTGTSGLRNPTLGVYIEWWRNYECAWTKDKYGARQPIYYIAGSPLSGCNACAYVDTEGNGHTVSVYPFNNVWHSFMSVNAHYAEAKQLYEAYSLEEVIERLFGNSSDNISD